MSFKPDYARFGIQNLSSDMISLLKKRVYDIGALTDSTSKVKIIYNREVIPVKNFHRINRNWNSFNRHWFNWHWISFEKLLMYKLCNDNIHLVQLL